MDAKITKKRLGLLLSYDWIKIIGICVAAVLVWVLLFTTMATRATNGQSFDIYLYPNVYSHIETNTLHTRDENDALSYDVLDISLNSLTSDTMSTILSAHFAAGQGDVMFVPYSEPQRDAETGEITAYSGLDAFLASYSSNCLWLAPDGSEGEIGSGDSTQKVNNYFTDCENYLNSFYDKGWQNPGSFNEEAVRSHFNERMQGDKRYKNDSQRENGIAKEIERIQKLRDAYAKVKSWVTAEDGPVQVRTSQLAIDTDGDGNLEEYTWQYAFDLSNIDKLSELVYYYPTDTSDDSSDGSGTASGTSNGLCMVVLNTGSSGAGNAALRYEPFMLLNYLVEKYDTAA